MNNLIKTEKNRFISLFIGIFLVVLGLIMPKIINVDNLGIYPNIYKALQTLDVTFLIYATLKLVILNTFRALPHYVGAFFIRESLSLKLKKKYPLLGVGIVCAIIPMVYVLIYYIYGIRYDFGVPAIMLILLIIMLEKANFSFVNLPKKTLMIVFLISAMQFLDLIPLLSFLPIGRGETSRDIKSVALFLGAENFLHFITVIMFLLLFLCSLLLYKMILDENKLKLLMEERNAAQQALTEERIRTMKTRTQLELQQLVHDLKTPLTTAQALTSVIKLGCEKDGLDKYEEYLTKVELSMEHMSGMISEILYETKRSILSTKRVADLLLAQISNTDYAEIFSIENTIPNERVEVNEIRFVRAIINLIENSYHSVRKNNAFIKLKIFREKDYIVFVVFDKGIGIKPKNLSRIWEEGYSTKDSSGLGLSFVKQVVIANMGNIDIKSAVNEGTTVTIGLPAVDEI